MKKQVLLSGLFIIAAISAGPGHAQTYSSGGGSYSTGGSSINTGGRRFDSDSTYDSARNTDRLIKVIRKAPERSMDPRYSNEISKSELHDKELYGLTPGAFKQSMRAQDGKNKRGLLGEISDSIYRLWQKWGGYDVNP